MVKRVFHILCLLLLWTVGPAQLKFIVEDFEGFSNNGNELGKSGFFTYGGLQQEISTEHCTRGEYSGEKCLRIKKKEPVIFGGFGVGLGRIIELDQRFDHLNFYVFSEKSNKSASFRVTLQEDDNADHQYRETDDDEWTWSQKIANTGGWELISIPLSKFSDANSGGDGGFNISYHHGKLCVLLFSLENAKAINRDCSWYIDFVSFSKGPLPTGDRLFAAPPADPDDFCALGAWSEEGNSANFADIPKTFEGNFDVSKKLGVAHFFQSFSVEEAGSAFLYPSVARINKVIEAGYIPLITLEDHFVNASPGTEQPNLYSIVEGHFDSFFGYWAHQIKDVNGIVMLRILHEFNGDWYPWCTVNNNKDPYLVAKAFRYIVNIFRQNNVNNVKFIWCPNSMSVPQESWNFIMDAYPGDEYVDLVGLDIYNGAGTGEGVDIWRSFRKEGIENYFVLTQYLPSKPLLICETASRERHGGEGGQQKSEWIRQMGRSISTDMSKIKLLAWFDEKMTFKVSSSAEAKNAFSEAVLRQPFFVGGKKELEQLIK